MCLLQNFTTFNSSQITLLIYKCKEDPPVLSSLVCYVLNKSGMQEFLGVKINSIIRLAFAALQIPISTYWIYYLISVGTD